MRTDLRSARLSLGLTQAEVAERAGIAQSAISRIECGTLSVGAELAPRLAEALRLPILQVLYGPDLHPDVFGPAPRKRAA